MAYVVVGILESYSMPSPQPNPKLLNCQNKQLRPLRIADLSPNYLTRSQHVFVVMSHNQTKFAAVSEQIL